MYVNVPPEAGEAHGCVEKASLDTTVIIPFTFLELYKEQDALCLSTGGQATATEPHAEELVEQGCKLCPGCLQLSVICPWMGRCGPVGSKRISRDCGKVVCLLRKHF